LTHAPGWTGGWGCSSSRITHVAAVVTRRSPALWFVPEQPNKNLLGIEAKWCPETAGQIRPLSIPGARLAGDKGSIPSFLNPPHTPPPPPPPPRCPTARSRWQSLSRSRPRESAGPAAGPRPKTTAALGDAERQAAEPKGQDLLQLSVRRIFAPNRTKNSESTDRWSNLSARMGGAVEIKTRNRADSLN